MPVIQDFRNSLLIRWPVIGGPMLAASSDPGGLR